MDPIRTSLEIGSSRSSSNDSRMSDVLGAGAPPTQTTPQTTGSLQNLLKAGFELLATYLANAWVLEEYRAALERIYSTLKIGRAAKGPASDRRDLHITSCRLRQSSTQTYMCSASKVLIIKVSFAETATTV